MVLAALQPIWHEMPETASRVRGRIEVVIDWAKARGVCAGENPARWRGHLANLLPKPSKLARVEHHAALPFVDIPSFMLELASQKGLTPRALEFAILTASRTSEALGARWEEFDFSQKVWVVPAERMKAGKAIACPLARRTIEILKDSRPSNAASFVFPGHKQGRALSNMSLLMLLRRMQARRPDGTRLPIDIQRLGSRDNAVPELCCRDGARAHRGRKVESAYRRGDLFDKRRKLMDTWDAYCRKQSAEIVPLVHRRVG